MDYLFSLEELETDFANFEFLELKKTTITLKEGDGHVGKGSVIRFLGQKK